MDGTTGVSLLLVEDDADDARFVERLLTEFRGGTDRPIEVEHVEHVESLAAGLDRVDAETDVVLLDLGLPDSTGVETVERTVEQAPTVPVVVLTGRADAGIDAIRSGAQDYLLKGHITATLLLRSLRYAIERTRVTRELRDRTHRLAVANEILRTDLHNDVSLIVGLADQLEAVVRPEERATVDELLDASRHVLGLTDTVADLMDVLSGVPPTHREPIDLRTVLDSALERLRSETDVDLTVEWRVPPDESLVVAGTPMLGSVVQHLLTDAATRSLAGRKRLTVTIDAAPDRVTVAVADDGTGIPDAQKAAIVDPDADSDDRRTIGAALYFVATAIDLVDGDIEVVDDTPSGTVVTVTLDRLGRPAD